jgi:hypothetical protein
MTVLPNDVTACARVQVGFRAYVAARMRRISVPDLAMAAGLDASVVDAVFAGDATEDEMQAVVRYLEPEIADVAELEAAPRPTQPPEKLSIRQRQLVGWRLYLHLKSTGRARSALAVAAGVGKRTIRRILAIEQNVSTPTVATVIGAAEMDLAAALTWPPCPDTPRAVPAAQATPVVRATATPDAVAPVDGPPRVRRRILPGSPRASWPRLITGFAVVVAIMVGYVAGRSNTGSADGAISLRAPIRATTNEATVVGDLGASSSPLAIVLYVRPESSRTYYRQSTEVLIDQARYQAKVRLGDEHMDEPSLEFWVMAAAVPLGKEGKLPGTFADPGVEADSDEQFLGVLARLSTGVSNVARIVRVGATPKREQVRLRRPTSGSRIQSPFTLEWDPDNLPLYVEIRSNAREVATASGPGHTSGSLVRLAPGRYELKLRRSPQEPVLAVATFEVVPSPDADRDEAPR